FETMCNASQGVSNIAAPQNISYSQSGMQYMNFNLDSNDVTTYYTDSIYIGVAPDVNFTNDSACVGQPVAFTNLTTISQGNIVNQLWDFGDTNTDTSLNPVHTYSAAVTYTVTLTVLGSSGCAGSYSVNLTVHDLPVAGFTFPNDQCANTPVPFTDISSAPSGESIIGWEWNFGDSTPVEIIQNPTHAFDSVGTYTVQLIAFASSGCADTITHTINILANPVAGFTVSNTCVGDLTQFTNTTDSAGAGNINYNWNFGDSFTDTNPNPTHTYSGGPANYNVQLIANAANGCKDTLEINIHISSKANPGFVNAPDTACIGNMIQFTDTSTIAAGDSIIIRNWDFGDSTSDTGTTVTHVYTSFGTFTVTLTVTSETACDTSISKTITVLESPTAQFNFANVCLGFPMSFANNSITPGGSTIDSILWDFGDGNFDTGQSVQNLYTAAGFYDVILRVVNNFGCSDTNLQVVQVYERPFATFSTSLACSGDTVHFTNGSFIQNDTITSYQWDFDDGSLLSFDQHPDHVYDSSGTYSVTLTVTSSHGCIKDTTIDVVVQQSPQFNFSASLTCLGDNTLFTYLPLQNPDPGLTWLWSFGDGNSSPQVNPSHPYSLPGTYTVILTVTGNNTCQGSISNTVTIHENPVAGITANQLPCIGSNTVFTDNSTISSPDFIAQWIWNFGDGSPLDNNQNTNHIYTNVATDTVTLIVTSNAGCSDTTTKIIDVQPLPLVSYTPDHTFGSPPFTVQFVNTTTGATTYNWTFGDGSSFFGMSPSHTYTDTGFYNVTLTATSVFGCTDSILGDVIVLIPYLDLGIKNIHATVQNDLLAISADLANFGNIRINNFQISTHTETGSMINEQWSSAIGLKAGEIMTYNFIARYEIDSAFSLPSFFCVDISEINGGKDSVENNNHKCAAIETVFELFDIHPNPSGSEIAFGINVPEDGEVIVSYYDALGQIVKKEMVIPVTKGHNEITDSVRNFANGFYMCMVKFRDQVLSKKLMKNK
ncbi:MAG: PKD domain-containing protein, partial [Bacteroidia bacterium]